MLSSCLQRSGSGSDSANECSPAVYAELITSAPPTSRGVCLGARPVSLLLFTRMGDVNVVKS